MAWHVQKRAESMRAGPGPGCMSSTTRARMMMGTLQQETRPLGTMRHSKQVQQALLHRLRRRRSRPHALQSRSVTLTSSMQRESQVQGWKVKMRGTQLNQGPTLLLRMRMGMMRSSQWTPGTCSSC